MSTLKEKENLNSTYKELKSRLRMLLKNLEEKCDLSTIISNSDMSEIKDLENYNSDVLKQTNKIKKLHEEFLTLTEHVRDKKVQNIENIDPFYSESKNISKKQSRLDDLEQRQIFLYDSFKSIRQQLNEAKHNLLLRKGYSGSTSCCKMGDCLSYPSLEIQKKLSGLKEKCDKMRSEYRCLLYNSMNFKADDGSYLNQYNNLLKIYADRIATMTDLCAKYKKMIRDTHVLMDETTSLPNIRHLHYEEGSINTSANYKSLSSKLNCMNAKLKEEVNNIESAIQTLKLMKQ